MGQHLHELTEANVRIKAVDDYENVDVTLHSDWVQIHTADGSDWIPRENVIKIEGE